MRRSASEIIRNLESRIARLEKQSKLSKKFPYRLLDEIVEEIIKMERYTEDELEEVNFERAPNDEWIYKVLDQGQNKNGSPTWLISIDGEDGRIGENTWYSIITLKGGASGKYASDYHIGGNVYGQKQYVYRDWNSFHGVGKVARLEKSSSKRTLLESVKFVDSMEDDELSALIGDRLNNEYDDVYFTNVKVRRQYGKADIEVFGKFQMDVEGVRLYHVDKVFEEIAKKTRWNTRPKSSDDPRGESTTILQIMTIGTEYILEVYPDRNGNYYCSLYAEGERDALNKKQMDTMKNDDGQSFSSGVKRIFRETPDTFMIIGETDTIENDANNLIKLLKPMGDFLTEGFADASHHIIR